MGHVVEIALEDDCVLDHDDEECKLDLDIDLDLDRDLIILLDLERDLDLDRDLERDLHLECLDLRLDLFRLSMPRLIWLSSRSFFIWESSSPVRALLSFIKCRLMLRMAVVTLFRSEQPFGDDSLCSSYLFSIHLMQASVKSDGKLYVILSASVASSLDVVMKPVFFRLLIISPVTSTVLFSFRYCSINSFSNSSAVSDNFLSFTSFNFVWTQVFKLQIISHSLSSNEGSGASIPFECLALSFTFE